VTLSILFAPQIRAFGKAAGREFTRAEVETIETTMNAVASLDDGGHVRFDLGAGSVGTLDDALTMMSVGMGAPVTASTAASSAPIGSNATERAVAMNAAIRTGADARKRDQASALVRTYGNPWKTNNRTHMAYVTNVAPDMASRLRREAGERA
jgi:hypothetical protein